MCFVTRHKLCYNLPDAPVAQVDRAPDFESVGCEFESRRARSASLFFLV